MKVPHSEGVGNHTDPLSCVGHRYTCFAAPCPGLSVVPTGCGEFAATVAANRLQWPYEPG